MSSITTNIEGKRVSTALPITFRIYSRFNGLNPLLDEVPSFLGTWQTKEILNVRAKGLRQTEGLLECGILL